MMGVNSIEERTRDRLADARVNNETATSSTEKSYWEGRKDAVELTLLDILRGKEQEDEE
jgi:hypothetical protein